MSHRRFGSVAVAQQRAERRLPASVRWAIRAGTEKGLTAEANVTAFDQIGLVPRLLPTAGDFDVTAQALGNRLALPVMLSPTGGKAVHPSAEVAVARAATAAGTVLGVSIFATARLEPVVAHNEGAFYQVYWIGGREEMAARVRQARAAGARGLAITLDWSFSQSRDRGAVHIPDALTPREMLRFAPEAVARPRWLTSYLRTGTVPQLVVPNAFPGAATPLTLAQAFGRWAATPAPSWSDIAWLRDQWDGPFLVKGVATAEDARAAVATGASAVGVSNHGGNNLDGAPPSIRTLRRVAEAVGDSVEVIFDGGIRRGSDVVKAVALGADAVMIGRPYLWGLAVAGQAGVENVLEVLRAGIESTLYGLGLRSIAEVTQDNLIVPEGFDSVC